MTEATDWTVEAWRGLAAWMVVCAHYWAGAQGAWTVLRFTFTGVDLFFVLSGFVFAPYFFGRPLVSRAFALRRFFRIYPTYLLALGVYFGMVWWQGGALAYVWQHLVFAYLQSREMAFYYNPVFWSLPSEVEFYLLLPLLAKFARRGMGYFVVLGLAALVLRALLGYASDAQAQNAAYIWMHHLPGMLIEFLFGAGAWFLSEQGLRRLPRAVLLVAGVVLWLVLAAWFGRAGDVGVDASWARGQMGWLAALCFAAMVAATVGAHAAPHVALVSAAVWAGRLSYGSYLFHIAALRVVQAAAPSWGTAGVTTAGAALTLVLAWVGYKFWENPWRRFGRTLASRS